MKTYTARYCTLLIFLFSLFLDHHMFDKQNISGHAVLPDLAFQKGTASLNAYVWPKFFLILFPGEIVPHECVTRSPTVVMTLLRSHCRAGVLYIVQV